MCNSAKCTCIATILSCSWGIISIQFSSFHVVAFGKLQVIHVGNTRQFCGLKHSLVRQACTLPLTRIMNLVNDIYDGLLLSAILPAYCPFQSNAEDNQAGIFVNTRCQTVPFIWLFVMFMCDEISDYDVLLQCAFQPEVVN